MLDPSWIIGHAKTGYTNNNAPIKLTTKSGEHTTLRNLVQSAIPPCRLNPLLFNGHLQTMWTAVHDDGPPVIYKRAYFQSEHEVYKGQFAVDFVVDYPSPKDETLPERTTYYSEDEFKNLGSSDDKPMVIACHGLTGGSHEVYLRQTIAPLTAAGWEACVINARGCALSKITSPVMFNARTTWDLRQLVKWLRKTFPNRPLFGVGFSLGGNLLTNYVGEEGADCQLKAAVVISNPWNLEVSHYALVRSIIGRDIYSRALCTNVHGLFERHKDQLLKNPKVSAEGIRSARYLHEIDRYLQAPSWGYPTEGAYYRDASSTDAISAIKIPFLAINAEDDPISSIEAIPYREIEENANTVLCTTTWGGHLSWFQIGGKRWFATAVANVFMKLHKDIDFGATAKETKEVNGDAGPRYPLFDPSHRRMNVPL